MTKPEGESRNRYARQRGYDTILFRSDQLNRRVITSLAMKRRLLWLVALPVLLAVGFDVRRSESSMASPQAPSTGACSPIPPPPCKDGASPGVIQILPEAGSKLKLARKRFYLSSCPFNLSANVDVSAAPTLRAFYSKVGATPRFIAWLEDNHCETIYCRQLTIGEVTCEGGDQSKCVPEFTSAYRNALTDQKSNDLALKMITNYTPLSDSKLRVGFYEARAEWLKNAVTKIESVVANDYRLRSTITDKDGIGFFYDLCPGSYYVSSVAPLDIEGNEIVWEGVKPIQVDGPPDKNDATKVTLAISASNKKNTIVGKSLSDWVKPKPAAPKE